MRYRQPRFRLIFLVLAIVGAITAYMVWKPHPRPDQEAAITINADSLVSAFLTDEKTAQELYMEKPVRVQGVVVEMSVNQSGQTVVVLGSSEAFSSVVCTLGKGSKIPKPGDQVNILGFCSGLLQDVVIRDGVLLED